MSTPYLQNFLRILHGYRTEKQLKDFLIGILTPQELREIPTRLEIVRMLKKGHPHREIAAKLGVGIATVTRGAREIKQGRFKDL